MELDGDRPARPLGAADAQGPRRAHRHGHAGSEILAEPGDARRPPAHRSADRSTTRSPARRRGGARSKCSRRCRSAIPSACCNAYPHEVSGGMGQRIMIAMMLIPGPDLLIADEPTSALDVTVQLQVLGILDELVRERGMGLIFISHDLRLVATFCDRVLVMYAGRIVEELAGGAPQRRQPSLYARPAQLPAEDRRRQGAAAGARPRRGVERVTPRLPSRQPAAMTPSSRSTICSRVRPRRRPRRGGARRRASRSSTNGSFGIVGESGSGKSTVLRAICGLAPTTAGRDPHRRRAGPRAARPRLRPPRPDGVPGPLRLAASAPHRRPRALRAARHPRLPRPRGADRRRRWRTSGSARRSASAFRTSSPAASASASPSPAR